MTYFHSSFYEAHVAAKGLGLRTISDDGALDSEGNLVVLMNLETGHAAGGRFAVSARGFAWAYDADVADLG